MALTRKAIIEKIDVTIRKLHDIYGAAFQNSNKKLATGAIADLGGVFEKFWEMMQSYPEFSSLEQLEQMYDNARRNFEPHVDMFCDNLRFPKLFFSEDAKKPLKQFIELYYLLMRQRYILWCLDEVDTPKKLQQSATEINLAIQVSKLNSQMEFRATFIKVEAELTTILFKQACKLGELSYLKSDINVVAPQQAVASVDALLTLDRLRSVAQINGIIERLDLARSKKEQVIYAVEISALRAAIAEIDGVKKSVNDALADRFELFDQIAHQLNEHSAIIDTQMDVIKQNERYFEVLNLLKAMNTSEQLKMAAAQASSSCQIQSTLERYTKGFIAIDDITFGRITTAWHEASKTTIAEMEGLATDISRWHEQYSEIMKNFVSINEDRAEIERQNASMIEQARAIHTKKSAMQHLQLIFDQAYDHVINTLQEHVAIQFDATNSAFAYFKRHWWQGLTGGVLGGGGGTGLSFLLILDPTKLSLLIAGGVVFGGSLGIGAGTVYDYFFFKPKPALRSNDDLAANPARSETDRLLIS